jgi:predicted O-methyltransferase YrrM
MTAALGRSPDEYWLTAAHDWFSPCIPIWERLLADFATQPRRVLEIGSHEGRSAIWMVEHKLQPGDLFVSVDIWKTPPVEETTVPYEANFDHNMALVSAKRPGITIVKRKGDSRVILPKLISEEGPESFDLIYVDGYHTAPYVLNDLVCAFTLCKVGGYIFCDDYLWLFGTNPARTPKLAIDSFASCYCESLSIIGPELLYQMYFRKTAS